MQRRLLSFSRYAISLLGFGITIVGYLEGVFSLGLSQLTWIAIGNLLLLLGLWWSFLAQRKEFENKFEIWKNDYRRNFLANNPEFRKYEKLWVLHCLLSEAKQYLSRGGLPGGEGAHQDWEEKVETSLRQWNPDFLNYYKLNLAPNDPLEKRVRKLEETLEWITFS